MIEPVHYEFRALGRPLSLEQQRALRKYSRSSSISTTRFATRRAGQRLADAIDELMETTFDAFIHWAEFDAETSFRRLDFRLPGGGGALPRIDAYCRDPDGVGPALSARPANGCVIVTIEGEAYCDDAYDPGAAQPQDWLARLLPLRDELLQGDYRALYLAWLGQMQDAFVDDDETEPPVPPGLCTLNDAHQALADFLDIEADLVSSAAEASPPLPRPPSVQQLAGLVRSLPTRDKDDLLVATLQGDGDRVRAQLLARFASGATMVAAQQRRTVRELRMAAQTREDERESRHHQKREARARESRRFEAKLREAHLTRLSADLDRAWDRVGAYVATRRPQDYDRAVELLADLRELAQRDGWERDFFFNVRVIREENARKQRLLERLDRACLIATGKPTPLEVAAENQ